MKFKFYISFLTLLTALNLNAQDCDQKATGNSKIAGDYFSWGMFPCALKEYLIIYEKKPDSKKINRKIAQCYLNSAGANKSLAIKYLDFLIKAGKPDNEVYYELGQAYLYVKEFDKSIVYLNKYLEIAKAEIFSKPFLTPKRHVRDKQVSRKVWVAHLPKETYHRRTVLRQLMRVACF